MKIATALFLLGVVDVAPAFSAAQQTESLLTCSYSAGSHVYGCHLIEQRELAPKQTRDMIATVRYDFACHFGPDNPRTMEFGVKAIDTGNYAHFDYGKVSEVEVRGRGPFIVFDNAPRLNFEFLNRPGCALTAHVVHVRPSEAAMLEMRREGEALIDALDFLQTTFDALTVMHSTPDSLAALANIGPERIAARLARINAKLSRVPHHLRNELEADRALLAELQTRLERGAAVTERCDADGSSEATCASALEGLRQRVRARWTKQRGGLVTLHAEIAAAMEVLSEHVSSEREFLQDLMTRLGGALERKIDHE